MQEGFVERGGEDEEGLGTNTLIPADEEETFEDNGKSPLSCFFFLSCSCSLPWCEEAPLFFTFIPPSGMSAY